MVQDAGPVRIRRHLLSLQIVMRRSRQTLGLYAATNTGVGHIFLIQNLITCWYGEPGLCTTTRGLIGGAAPTDTTMVWHSSLSCTTERRE